MRKIQNRTFLRMFLVIVGVLMFIVFVVPLSLSVALNIGNLTGLIVSALLVIYGLFYNRINRICKEWKQKKYKKFFVYFAEGVIVLTICLVVLMSILMIRSATNKPVGNETVIILGCRVYGENPSLSLMDRMDAAYEYLVKYPETYCVVSGGQGDGENISEAECMYRYLTDKGIDGNRIFKEEASTSTRENIAFSLKVIEENNLPDTIAIATS